MLTHAKTTLYDFTVEAQQQILDGNAARVWVQFLLPLGGNIGIDFVQRQLVSDCAFALNQIVPMQLTKGDLGSIIGNPMYATSNNPSATPLWVTEILLD